MATRETILTRATRTGTTTGSRSVARGDYFLVEAVIDLIDRAAIGGEVGLFVYEALARGRRLLGGGTLTTQGPWTDRFGVAHPAGASPKVVIGESLSGKDIEIDVQVGRGMTYSLEAEY